MCFFLLLFMMFYIWFFRVVKFSVISEEKLISLRWKDIWLVWLYVYLYIINSNINISWIVVGDCKNIIDNDMSSYSNLLEGNIIIEKLELILVMI